MTWTHELPDNAHPNRHPDYAIRKKAKSKAKYKAISAMKKKHPELSRKQIQTILRG